ncbi:MAG TPA: crossover junction endodeoxyribonuclease RuvC, partial [Patescibacteria group bacterium]|nr:crossover junction endodeoxyribonuclease RuvC [Patescibacteria group bacterium]
MRILGIDPGTAIVGWGIIDTFGHRASLVASGHIQTSKNKALHKRLAEISHDIITLVKKYKPEEAAVEELFFFKNHKTVISVAQARGCILLTLENAHVTLYDYTPLEIKQALTSYGRAEKSQVQLMVRTLLKLATSPKQDDEAD